MNQKILLVEPAYKTKYPPLGLMKLSTYHKSKGDEVFFVKGCNNDMRNSFWDRIYITTLFTWTWNETVKTIRFYCDTLFNFSSKCFVGGILATLMPEELFNATGVQPVIGLLDDPKKIQQEDNIIIDELPPDYEILEQVENPNFQYTNKNAYLGYATKGCIRKCKYCAVRKLEPKFVPYLNIQKLVKAVNAESGEKQNLILMDNNILASPDFGKIIDDIKSIGFVKGAVFGPTRRKRVVDFNQGLDARLLTEKKMKILAEIPIEPMRIAFDDIRYKDVYIKAVRLANKYGQNNMSNYVLYNYKDTPDDFYERLKINIELNEEFKKNDAAHRTCIYSFPMRYIPLSAKKRDVSTGNGDWNKKYLRSIKVILNVTKGPVMPGAEFFYQAFGRNPKEFRAILLMPEDFIRNRLVKDWRNISNYLSRCTPYVRDWLETFYGLNDDEKFELTSHLSNNGDITDFLTKKIQPSSNAVLKLLKMHIEAETIVEKYKNEK